MFKVLASIFIFFSRGFNKLGKIVDPPPKPDLTGDRSIENSWVAAKLPRNPGKVLDFGSGTSDLHLFAVEMGHSVTCVDLEGQNVPYVSSGHKFIKGDLLDIEFGPQKFDAIISCSTIEHVGIAGRYNAPDKPGDDIVAMKRLAELLAPDGILVMTLPVGEDALYAPYHRVYGAERLPNLLSGWRVEEKEFWVKADHEKWRIVDEQTALREKCSESYYGLGLYVLTCGDGIGDGPQV